MVTASGIGNFITGVLPTLSNHYRTTLLCRAQDRPYLEDHFSSHLIEIKSPIYSLREQEELARKIPAADFFWSPHFNIPLLPIRAKKRMTTIHDVYHLAFSSQFSWPQRGYATLMYNAALLLSDLITTPSQFSKKEIEKYALHKPKKIHVIPHGLTLIPEENTPQDFLLFVGNLKAHKNLVRTVQAYRKLQLQEQLVIVGKREGLKHIDHALFSLVESDPYLKEKILFTGYLSEQALSTYYSTAKILLFPSLYEGFGLPPLEAMACGCPVVAARTGSIPEVCLDAVEYVDPLSVDSIAEGIHSLLSNPQRRAELIERGKERFKVFSIQKTAHNLLHLLEGREHLIN